MRKGKKLLGLSRGAITLLSLPLGLLVAEVGVRIAGIQTPRGPVMQGAILRPCELEDVRLEPFPGGRQKVHYAAEGNRPEHFVWHGYNQSGIRGPEVKLEKTPGTVRIACIGDSHTFCFAVGERETWPAQLQDRLDLNSSVPCEVVNFGVNAYDTADELAWFKHKALPYKPDVLVVMFYVNDPPTDPVSKDIPWHLSLSRPMRTGVVASLRRTSRLIDLSLDLHYRNAGYAGYVGIREALYEPGGDSWSRCETALMGFDQVCEEEGIDLWLALFPFPARKRNGEATSRKPYRQVKETCSRLGIEVIDLEDYLAPFPLDDLRISAVDYHASPLAYKQAARGLHATLAPWLEAGGARD